MSAATWTLLPFLKQCIVATGVCLNNLGFACSVGYPAVLLPQLRESSLKLNGEQESWIVPAIYESAFYLSASAVRTLSVLFCKRLKIDAQIPSINAISLFAGNLLTVPAMRYGRRFTNYVISLLHVISWLIIVLAESYEDLMIGRFLNGAAHGLYVAVFGVMLGEYSSPAHRGAFFATVSLAQAAGVFFVHLVGSFLAWQDTAVLISCFPLISFIIAILTPESPSWLAVEGKYEDCRKSFRWLRGQTEDEELDKMIAARMYFKNSSSERSTRETLRAFCRREIYIPLIIGVSMHVILCNSGSLVIAGYLHDVVCSLIGPDSNMAGWMCLFNGVRLLCNGVAIYAMKMLPRRGLILWSGFICILMYLSEAAFVFAKNKGLVDVIWLPALLGTIHTGIIGLGLVTVPYMIVGEIFPLQYRGSCSFVCSVPLCVIAFLVLKTFPGLAGKVGLEGAWVVYAVTMALALVVVWYLLPETRGRTLQDIEEHFRGNPLPDDPEARMKLNEDGK